MWNLIKLIFNVVCDLLAAIFIVFGLLGIGWIFIVWIIFMKIAVLDVILIVLAAAFMFWRVIRWWNL